MCRNFLLHSFRLYLVRVSLSHKLVLFSRFSGASATACLPARQKGFLLPTALFIVIAVAALAIGVSRLSSQSGESVFREGISIQAFYAAESGLQWGMNQVMFPNANRALATTNCSSLEDPDSDVFEIVFSSAGLQGCNVNLSCSSSNDSSASTTFYSLTSTASCGAGELMSERTIEASAYLRD